MDQKSLPFMRSVTMTVDSRLVADWNFKVRQWNFRCGTDSFRLASSAEDPGAIAQTTL